MAKIINLPCDTTLDIPCDKILKGAEGRLAQVLLIGVTADGEEYYASSIGNKPEMIWMIEKCKRVLLGDYND